MDRCGWIATSSSINKFPTLGKDIKTDFLIVGAGIAGISCAINLARINPSQRIVLVEKNRLGQGASSRNSGFVVCHEKPGDGEYINQAGFERYRQETQFGTAASQLVAQYVKQFDIDCDFDPSGYFIGVSDSSKMSDPAQLLATLNAVGAQVSLQEGDALAARLGTDFYKIAVHCAGGNALIQPAKYVQGLIAALPPNVEVYEQVNVHAIHPAAGNVLEIRGNGHCITTDRVIVCAGAYPGRAGVKSAHILPLELTASLTRPLNQQELNAMDAPQPWGILSAALTGATVRLTQDRRLMIRNTLEYRCRDVSAAELQARQNVHLAGLQRRFPWLVRQDIAYTWSGHLSGTRTGNPLFKQWGNQMFTVSGCNGSGIARGTLWGKLLAEYASGESSDLLRYALKHGEPGWLPPRPFLDIGASLKIGYERFKSSSEI